MNSDFETMNELMATLEQSGAWSRIYQADPNIQRANRELGHLLEGLDKPLSMEIADAVCSAEYAVVGAAILFGMRIAREINAALDNPCAVSQYALDKREGKL